MIVYHGSFLEIPTPDIRHSRPRVDFGPGFYTTPLFEQASKWCNRFKDKGRDAVVNRYVCNDEIYASLKLLTFDYGSSIQTGRSAFAPKKRLMRACDSKGASSCERQPHSSPNEIRAGRSTFCRRVPHVA